MSLEEALAKNTAALEKQTEILNEMLTRGKAAAGDKPATAADKKKAAAKGKEEKSGDDDDTASFDAKRLAAVRGLVSDWLNEFKGKEGDPETAARREKLEKALLKLGGGKTAIKISDITDDTMTERVEKWIAKTTEEGRLTPDPDESGDEESGDDEEI